MAAVKQQLALDKLRKRTYFIHQCKNSMEAEDLPGNTILQNHNSRIRKRKEKDR